LEEFMKNILIATVALSLLVAGCSQAHDVSNTENKAPKLRKNDLDNSENHSWQQVTVKHMDFEGGFYGLVSSNGDKLLPMNLAKKYQLPGTVLKVKGEIVKGMMTIQQWGRPYKISNVELIKLGKADEASKGVEY